jgi:hypothetical protein
MVCFYGSEIFCQELLIFPEIIPILAYVPVPENLDPLGKEVQGSGKILI